MRVWALAGMLAVLVLLIVGTAVRVGAHQEQDPRTFVFVRNEARKEQNIPGALVVFRSADGEVWTFPFTNDGGWTKREVPDDRYRVTVSADGWKTRTGDLLVPARSKYPHRTFVIYLEKQ